MTEDELKVVEDETDYAEDHDTESDHAGSVPMSYELYEGIMWQFYNNEARLANAIDVQYTEFMVMRRRMDRVNGVRQQL